MATIGPIQSFEQVRRAIIELHRRFDQADTDTAGLIDERNLLDAFITERLLTYGVRIARITQEVAPAEDTAALGGGYAVLVNKDAGPTIEDQEVFVYNISEKTYTIGTLVALLNVQDSFFVCSDPGVFVDVPPPLVSRIVPVNAASEGSFLTAPVDSVVNWLDLDSGTWIVTDDLDTGSDAIIDVTIGGPGTSVAFAATAGDSGVTVSITPPTTTLTGTIAELHDLFSGGSTGTLTSTFTQPGIYLLKIGITASDGRRETYEYTVVAVARGARGYDVQVFTTTGSNTWNKPSGAVTVYRHLIGGGGGGGSGRNGAAASNRGGGGGGGGGGYSFDSNLESEFASSETVTVGAGGAGGASQGTNDSDGNSGSDGGDTSMAATGSGGATLTAGGGTGGGAGTTSGGAGGTGGTGTGGENGAAGGAGATSGNATAGSSSTSLLAGAGGGGAGGISSADTGGFSAPGGSSAGNGGVRGVENHNAGANTFAAFRGGNGESGSLAIAGSSIYTAGGGGAGGGGSTASTAAGLVRGGSGGQGGRFGGGGGGGAAKTNVADVIVGFTGGPGLAVIITLLD